MLFTEVFSERSWIERIRMCQHRRKPRRVTASLCGRGKARPPLLRVLGGPSPRREGLLSPTELEGLRENERLSQSRGGSLDFTKFCSGDRDTAQAAPAGDLSPFFFSCLYLTLPCSSQSPGIKLLL